MRPINNNLPVAKFAFLGGVIFLLLVLESGFFGRLGMLPFGPQLVLLFVACLFTFGARSRDVFYSAAIAGLLGDFASGLPDGVIFLSLVSSYAALVVFNRSFLTVKASFQVSYGMNVFILTAFYFLAISVFSYLLSRLGVGSRLDWQYLFSHTFVWAATINLLAAFPFAWCYATVLRSLKIKTA